MEGNLFENYFIKFTSFALRFRDHFDPNIKTNLTSQFLILKFASN